MVERSNYKRKKIRVLFVANKNKLKPIGGPVGYLYHLWHGLGALNNNLFEFTIDNPMERAILDKNNLTNHNSRINSMLKGVIKKILPKGLLRIFYYYVIAFKLFLKSLKTKNIVNNFDIIHFHSSHDLFLYKKQINKNSTLILLTTHSPKPPHLEIIDNYIIDYLSETERKIYYPLIVLLRRIYEKIDEIAFNLADYVIFPSRESEEAYMKLWNTYQNLNIKKKYIPTGVRKVVPKYSRSYIRKFYGIPSTAFVVSYTGRHNTVKGYDLLKKIGEHILSSKSNVYFLITGKEEPLGGLEHSRWLELGWVDDPHSIVYASDLFVLPNRETYFDLSLLQALSLGQILLVSNRGGNKFFKFLENKGIFYFNDINEAIALIEYLIEISPKQKRKFNFILLKTYNKHFTEIHFAKRYLDMLMEISIGTMRENQT